jgi:hypothetical protein
MLHLQCLFLHVDLGDEKGPGAALRPGRGSGAWVQKPCLGELEQKSLSSAAEAKNEERANVLVLVLPRVPKVFSTAKSAVLL